MKLHFSMSLVVALAAFTLPQKPARADLRQVAGNTGFRFSGIANLTKTADPCIVLNHETGEGNAPSLGHLTWSDFEVVNFCSVSGGIDVVSQFTLTDKNGSKIMGRFATRGLFEAGGNLKIEGRYEISAGTGRFEKAHGAGKIKAQAKTPDANGQSAFTALLEGI